MGTSFSATFAINVPEPGASSVAFAGVSEDRAMTQSSSGPAGALMERVERCGVDGPEKGNRIALLTGESDAIGAAVAAGARPECCAGNGMTAEVDLYDAHPENRQVASPTASNMATPILRYRRRDFFLI
jgi:hypothetical protein